MGVAADAALTLRVKAALIGDERIGARTIDVDSSDGVVTLAGSVPYAAVRDLAEAAARRHGAQDVVNRLEVEHPDYRPESTIIPPGAPTVTTEAGAERVTEAPLQERVRLALEEDRRVSPRLAVVRVENGVVHLSGRQPTVQAWEAATETAIHVPGVLAVENEMEIMPAI